jgi:peptidyl-prolyl cis-trans isomerase SurA
MRRNLLTSTATTTRATGGAVTALVLAAGLALGACSAPQDTATDSASATSAAPDTAAGTGDDEAAATAAGTLDTASLPDPVAEVNGEEIPRADFVSAFEQERTAAQQQAQAGGAPVDETALADSVLESLVGSALFTQEGERLGLEADTEEIDAELDSLAEENGVGSRQELLDLLAEQGVEEQEVRDEVGRVLVIDEVLAERGGVEAPTDKELRAYYDQLTEGAEPEAGAAATGEAGLPAFDEVKDQLADQLTQEKENEALSTILEELEKDAKITRHL